MFLETVLGCVVALAGAYFYREHKKDKKQEVAPTPAVVNHVGKYIGNANQANQIAWGDANDEHTPEYTAEILTQVPQWRGLQYCPAGPFDFEVHPDGGITGKVLIFNEHVEPVQGRPVLPVGANEIEFALASHMVKLKFENGKVSGLLWEGHDLLKRANIIGQKI